MNREYIDAPYVGITEVFDALTRSGYSVPFVKVSRQRCDLIYGRQPDGSVSLLRCVPHKGVFLFEVSGEPSHGSVRPRNIFLAESKKEAKRRFKNIYGWDASEVRRIMPGEEADEILTDPLRMPI